MTPMLSQKSYFLTVSESKRLIARAVARHPLVREAIEGGTIAVAKGTTNSYIVEELLGTPIHKPHYCTGTSQPKKGAAKTDIANKLGDLVLKKGVRVENTTAVDILEEMGPGDIFIKGANALNYQEGVAGILIGHPTGGTIGAALGRITARRITLMIPVGLEKEIPWRIHDAAAQLAAAGKRGHGCTLWPVQGEIVTELEAIEVLTEAQAVPIGSGGINGGEGGVWIAVFGSDHALQRADELIESVQGEPPFAAATHAD